MSKKILILILFQIVISGTSFAAQILKFSDMKMLSQQTTSELVFDESMNIAPNFGINQIDPDLRPYFDPETGKSELCVPASLSNFLVYQMGITHTLPILANVPGVSQDLQSIDANALIVDLAKRCKTDPSKGTNETNLMNCIGEVMNVYFGESLTIDNIIKSSIDPKYPSYVQWENRAPKLEDIKKALKNGDPVLASVDWWKIDPTSKLWTRSGGHEFMIYGYGWESYFQDNLLQLDIMDPAFTWTSSTTSSSYNNEMAIRHKDVATSSIFLDGRGFNGQVKRGYLSSLTIIHINH